MGWLLGELERPDSSLSRAVGLPMLEYDLIDSGPNASLPTTHGLFLTPTERSSEAAFHNPGAMLATLACVAGMVEDAAERRTIEWIFAFLRVDEARVIHAGTFSARRPRGLHLVVPFRAMAQRQDFWKERDGRASQSQLKPIAAVMEPLTSGRTFGLDISPKGLGSTLGLKWVRKKGRLEDALDWMVVEDL